jgi:hypothetical protein
MSHVSYDKFGFNNSYPDRSLPKLFNTRKSPEDYFFHYLFLLFQRITALCASLA